MFLVSRNLIGYKRNNKICRAILTARTRPKAVARAVHFRWGGFRVGVDGMYVLGGACIPWVISDPTTGGASRGRAEPECLATVAR